VGILTDRDIVIELIAREVELDKIIIGDVMTRNLLTARESDSLSTVLSQMRGRGVRRVPVVNEQGGLEGIFSLDDLLELLAEQMHDFVAVLRKEANQEQRLRT
jgi:CBS domain-containing protein